MRKLSYEEKDFIEDFIGNYKDVIESIVEASDVETVAEYEAWKDWAKEEIVTKLNLSESQAIALLNKVRTKYK